MKKKNEAPNRTVKKIVSRMAEPMTEWPPTCLFIVYQPKRPVIKKEDDLEKH